MKPIDLTVAVWGEYHLGVFLNLTLAALLSPGNLPSLKGRLLIVTRPEDIETFKRHPLMQKASQVIEIAVISYEVKSEDSYRERYTIHTRMHKVAIDRSIKDGHMSAVIAGDMILADGYCKALMRWAEEGKRLVLGIGLRAGIESAGQYLINGMKDGTMTITPRQLVAVGLDHMHPINQASTWGEPYFSRMPYNILFPTGDGVVAHCFGLTAILMDCNERALNEGLAVDHDMARFFDKSEIYTVTDSDECMFCEVASITEWWPIFTRHPASPRGVARWAESQVCESMWGNFEHSLRFHTSDIGPHWAEVELTAQGVVDNIKACRG